MRLLFINSLHGRCVVRTRKAGSRGFTKPLKFEVVAGNLPPTQSWRRSFIEIRMPKGSDTTLNLSCAGMSLRILIVSASYVPHRSKLNCSPTRSRMQAWLLRQVIRRANFLAVSEGAVIR